MAEGFATKWLENGGHKCWQAKSAGTLASEGTPTSSETVQSLARRGIEFTGTSTPLTADLIHSSHIVLCMSQSHLDMAIALAGDSEAIELLDPNGSISDPVGHDQLVYDGLAEKLEELIASRLDTIIKKAGNM